MKETKRGMAGTVTGAAMGVMAVMVSREIRVPMAAGVAWAEMAAAAVKAATAEACLATGISS